MQKGDVQSDDFSIINGGPADQLMQYLGLLTPGSRRDEKRIRIFFFLTWPPMLVLSLLQGYAIGHSALPFLKDVNTYVRFLLALPLLLLAEPVIHERLRNTIAYFSSENLLPDDCRAQFTTLLALAVKRRNLLSVEILLFVFALLSSILLLQVGPSRSMLTSWQFVTAAHPPQLTYAGLWYMVVANVLFVFLIYRWLWRIAIWWELLARIASLQLRLIATHPDRAAGLGFLAFGQEGFALIILAVSFTIVAVGANKIIYGKMPLSTQEIPLLISLLLSLLILFGPLTGYCVKLFRMKIQGLLQYGMFAVRYTRAFEEKWIAQDASHSAEELLGQADVQSLADLGTSYEVIRRMELFPFSLRLLIAALGSALLPFFLLAAVSTPFETILDAIPKTLLRMISGR